MCTDTRHLLLCIVGFRPGRSGVIRFISRSTRLTPPVVLCVFVTELNADFNPSDHPRASTIFLSKSQNHGELLTCRWPVRCSSVRAHFPGEEVLDVFYFNGPIIIQKSSSPSANLPLLTNFWSPVFCDLTKGTDAYPRAATAPPCGHSLFFSHQKPKAYNSGPSILRKKKNQHPLQPLTGVIIM